MKRTEAAAVVEESSRAALLEERQARILEVLGWQDFAAGETREKIRAACGGDFGIFGDHRCRGPAATANRPPDRRACPGRRATAGESAHVAAKDCSRGPAPSRHDHGPTRSADIRNY
jgi:hypothetical protein